MQDIIHKHNQIIVNTQKHVFLQIIYTNTIRHRLYLKFYINTNYNTKTEIDARYYTQSQADNNNCYTKTYIIPNLNTQTQVDTNYYPKSNINTNWNTITQSDARYYTQTQADNN